MAHRENDGMVRNRVRELSEAKGWDVSELSRRSGLSYSYVHRIWNGVRAKRGLSDKAAAKLAGALGVPRDEFESMPVLTPEEFRGTVVRNLLREDAAPYGVDENWLVASALKDQPDLVPFVMKSNALDRIGILEGSIVVFDLSAAAVAAVQPLAVVLAQVFDEKQLTDGKTIIRQFVPPSLLTTNSSGHNQQPIDMHKADAHIRGVAVAVMRAL